MIMIHVFNRHYDDGTLAPAVLTGTFKAYSSSTSSSLSVSPVLPSNSSRARASASPTRVGCAEDELAMPALWLRDRY